MKFFFVLTLTGIAGGMIYAALAMALVLVWRATRVVNFAQGAMAMTTTYIALAVIQLTGNYWLGFIAALAAGLVMGAVAERGIVRWVENGPPLNAVILTLGLLLILEAVVPMIWGAQIRSFPAPFSISAVQVGAAFIPVSPFNLFTVGVVLIVMVALLVLFRFTDLGLSMRAAAFAPEIARLLGVRVGRLLTFGWGLATVAGALAGLLVAPSLLLYPNNMDAILVYGFTAAVLGGLDSPIGALVGGLAMGLALSFIGGYLGPDLETAGALAILIAILMVRPQGLFVHAAERRV
ncbi:MAG TPA: branched-chain amino acid ABC transporter permease [Candidatus Acidoferrum sp.]|jgi:branched-chain amino acid transport system permease protein|nr:branched-chain amino acid ABC transporter permease [Candidatus Acidoferrum sp.]